MGAAAAGLAALGLAGCGDDDQPGDAAASGSPERTISHAMGSAKVPGDSRRVALGALGRASVRVSGDGRASASALLPGRFAAVAGDQLAGHPDAAVVDAQIDLAGVLREQVLDHFGPLVRRLCACSRRPERALWRSVGDRAATAFLYAGEATGRRPAAERFAERVPQGPQPLLCRPRYVLVDGPGGPMRAHARRGCCLWWRTRAAATCLTCPLDARRPARA
jgi:hypothetical protein